MNETQRDRSRWLTDFQPQFFRRTAHMVTSEKRIIEKAWRDEQFKQALIDNPLPSLINFRL